MQRTDLDVMKARELAGEFAEKRAAEFLSAFLKDTGISEQLKVVGDVNGKYEDERWLELMTKDYQMDFGKAIALAYAMGRLDYIDEIPAKLYKTKKAQPVKLVDDKPQLILPEFGK